MDAARQRLLAPGGGARSGGRGGRRQRRDKHAASQGLAQDATDMASTLSFFLNAQRAMHEDSSDDHLEEEMMVSLSKRGEYTSKKYPNTHPLVVQAAVEHARALQAHGTPLAELWRSDNFNSAGQLNRARFMQRLRTTVSASASSERRFVPTFEHVASDSGNSSALRLLASFALVEMTTERAKLLGVAALGRLPTAMTCFNRLVLPAYPTEELLRQR
ncbi:hypothetical protein PTSG_05281 [Salpingoeca rosetta]|uniref:HECT domain-containing protein n=1 Tax=Salpingoeca rosetta (strain ATCC 50818 / BSB-021) TaxID=946362 RepID=F2U9Z9_SALR5|nr:uncharacterized protein PTSG_05281 [Salpingoeca rosetta]EGD73574.1 hypothetical protein PTSG_05281 [Salpingoeca rosetta]|eukprot:XP_004993856.1 hypothetical protein PTSG_05281 [Salpingoeca rosetta]